MANTTNYNWETPDDTDLVKDGAAAIRTLGNSIDTTTKALNPETTLGDIAYRSATSNTNTRLPIGTSGQILSVSGGVPAWINNDQGDITEVQAGTGISVASGTGPIPVVTNTVATAYDAKADLIAGTGADSFSRLAVGANDTVLTADSSTATGLKWAAPASGGGMTLLNSGSTTLSGTTTTFNITTTGYKHLFVVLKDIYTAAEGTSFNLRINGDTDGDYYHCFNYQFGTTTAGDAADGATSFPIQFRTSSTNGSYFFVSGGFWLMQVQDSTTHICNWQVRGHSNSGTGQTVTNGSGFYRASAVVSSISFVSGQSVSGGEAFIYGVK